MYQVTDCTLSAEAHNELIDSNGECRCGETRVRDIDAFVSALINGWDVVPA